jgi:hypothetical protein
MLHINVNEHTEKKGQLTYLSWAWAWAEVLKHDPLATWVVHTYGPQGAEQPCMWIGETAMVHTSVTVNGLRRECMLPVMDNKNNAVKLPDARKISDAIMRCMTKAISMHGLGLYIYAGEDFPEPEPESDSQRATREAREKRQAELTELALYMIDCEQAGKQLDAIRVWYAADTFNADVNEANEERIFVWGLLKHESKLRSAIKANKPVDKAEAWKAGQPEAVSP